MVFDIPIGCVQGSVLGPSLFNIYMSDLESCFPPNVFFCSYADDSYVGISCDVRDFEKTIQELELIMESHFKHLEDIGMVVNRSKTEIVVFNRWGDLRVNFPKLGLYSEPKMKILGIDFKYDLSWHEYVDKIIAKTNSLSYALRYVNSKLSRNGFKRLIHAHVLSRLTYGSQLWSNCVSYNSAQRLKSCYYKFLRLLTKDYKKKLDRKGLLKKSSMRSLESIFKIQACRLLHSICYNLTPSQLALSVLSRGYHNERNPGRLTFTRQNAKRIGYNSFTNRLHDIENVLDFDWLDMPQKTFNDTLLSRFP
jgi:hypothetical protein